MVWSFAGVRSLYDDGSRRSQDVTRDYVIELDAPAGAAPLLTVYGGKITTYRRLAEHALDRLSHIVALARHGPRNRISRGRISPRRVRDLVAQTLKSRPFLGEARRDGSCVPMERGSSACWARPDGRKISGARSAPTSPPPRCVI